MAESSEFNSLETNKKQVNAVISEFFKHLHLGEPRFMLKPTNFQDNEEREFNEELLRMFTYDTMFSYEEECQCGIEEIHNIRTHFLPKEYYFLKQFDYDYFKWDKKYDGTVVILSEDYAVINEEKMKKMLVDDFIKSIFQSEEVKWQGQSMQWKVVNSALEFMNIEKLMELKFPDLFHEDFNEDCSASCELCKVNKEIRHELDKKYGLPYSETIDGVIQFFNI